MTRWASFVVSRPRWVLTAAVVIVLAGASWGLGVFGSLSQGGYEDPGSEAVQVAQQIQGLGTAAPDIIVIYSAPEGRTLDDIGADVTPVLDAFRSEVGPDDVTSYWTAGPVQQPFLESTDGTKGLATVTLGSASGVTVSSFSELLPKLEVPGVETQFAGASVAGVSFNTQLQSDLVRAEMIAIPITLVLLVVIFGGVVAAAVPVIVGVLSVAGALTVLRVFTEFTEISSFAVNVASLLGLGLAIDYGLFIVSRFREELRTGASADEAARRTMLTAGRTIVFSGLLLICAFAGMLVFPQAIIRSLGYGAMAAVGCAALLSLTAVPAVLTLLGHRINAITWSRTASDRGDARAQKFWGSVVTKVMRRPIAVATLIIAGLLIVASPLVQATLGEVSYTALPADDPARIAFETLSTDFRSTGDSATIVLDGDTARPDGPAINAVTTAARGIDGIENVQFGTASGDFVVIDASFSSGVSQEAQQDVVEQLRAIPAPDGTELRVGGAAALVLDGNDAIVTWLPVMLTIMVVSTLILLFLAFGSVVLPVKAVAMAGLSMAATFGALTFIFQEGHGAGLLGVTPAPLEATFVVLILAVVFGLSTDYEVFLMSRMVEARTAGATTEEAVLIGAQRTGRIVTAAALILIIVTGAFSLSGLSIMRFLGVGMILALIIDATIIRMLLVPSLVKLMGEANWWAPAWMRRVHAKVGIGH
ncbi:MMPL family transporter [Rhodococcus sp. BP-349]|uniref:MMPL family transporter n=1 Tax=unclassified Rhodococcus (in: high G+C Gram-positive bacteria) TaxID=192944 RepID=UPI001C9B80BC|nr:MULTISPECIES: MMPL family transporter [unclassified Rhodococcus (in: high G+C Gram-positive bacteria)]MBY6538771.1 MMPL family transporter [Rhodococcus sp. BP-363]MBY6543108.1 MMPL family transporter [Rhodococcus sp. BP-369]MBY6562338.1 MMPL family transporter [Rhodococcus sp. BP-370]MBY6576630.1 MMPL family transporter [Rhodococcus sp. BP-364]MBY6585931.1 MMPL family transporter [Rhodococcus sp. BP-358]